MKKKQEVAVRLAIPALKGGYRIVDYSILSENADIDLNDVMDAFVADIKSQIRWSKDYDPVRTIKDIVDGMGLSVLNTFIFVHCVTQYSVQTQYAFQVYKYDYVSDAHIYLYTIELFEEIFFEPISEIEEMKDILKIGTP